MTVTLVLRLLRGPLDRDEVVGHAEIVSTGVSLPIRTLADVLAVAHTAAGRRPADGADPGHPASPAPPAEPGASDA